MKVICSFDDGTADDMRIAELLDKYDLDGIFYWIVYPENNNEMKGRPSLTPEQRKKIAEKHHIGSHTLSHPLLTRIPIDEARIEINKSKYLLEKELDVNITSFAYPRGYSNPTIQKFVEEAGYHNARGVTVGNVHQSENKFDEKTAVHATNRKEYGGLSWLEYGYKMLEEAINTPQSVYHLWGHSWEIDEQDGWYDLEQLMERLSNENTLR